MEKINNHILELISDYITNEISEKQYSELQEWIDAGPKNKQLFAEMLHLYKKSRNIKLLHSIDKTKAWDKIVSKLERSLEVIPESKNPKVISIRRPWLKYIAAILVGVLVSIYAYRNDLFTNVAENKSLIAVNNVVNNNIQVGTDKAILTLADGSSVVLERGKAYRTQNVKSDGKEIIYGIGGGKTSEVAYNYLTIPRGGQFFVKLSDGTQVWLNSETKLKYPTSFTEGETRQVELVYGEAYFDVSHSTEHKGSRFKVNTSFQEVEVLGTEFDIKAYLDESQVFTTLVKGKVTVGNDVHKAVLKPNEQSILDKKNKEIIVTKIDVYNEISWKEGVFSFEGKPLKDIMKVLSRWYDVDIVFANKKLEDTKFIGVLGREQKIEDILRTIKGLGFIKSYKIDDKEIILN